jgi:OPT oligopeptide transporter protein
MCSTCVVQLVATVLAGFVQVGVKEWLFANVHNLCSPTQKDLLTCPHNEVQRIALMVKVRINLLL